MPFFSLLKGFDKDWSSSSKKAEKDYTNLPAGTYTFQVKAKNNLGSESAINDYSNKQVPAEKNLKSLPKQIYSITS